MSYPSASEPEALPVSAAACCLPGFSDAERRDALIALLRRLRPEMRKIPALHGEGASSEAPAASSRVLVKSASIVELERAVESELERLRRAALATPSAFKGVEGRFGRTQMPGFVVPGAPFPSVGCTTILDAIEHGGALDFCADAPWRGDESLMRRCGIVAIDDLPSALPADATSVGPAVWPWSTDGEPDCGGGAGIGEGGHATATAARPCTCAAPVADEPRVGGRRRREIFGLAHLPGVYILPQGACVCEQEYWIRRLLVDIVEPPQRRNIDAEVDPDYSNAVASVLGPDGARVVRLPDGRFVSYADSLRLTAAAAGDSPPTMAVLEGGELLSGPKMEAVSLVGAQTIAAASDPPALKGGATPGGSVPSPSSKLAVVSSREEPTPSAAAPTETKCAEESKLPQPAFESNLWAALARAASAASTLAVTATPAIESATPATPPSDASSSAGRARTDATFAAAFKGSTLEGVAWATVGHQYDWTARQYHLEGDPDYHLHSSAHTSRGGGAAGASAGSPTASRWYAPFPLDLRAWSSACARSVHEAVSRHILTHGVSQFVLSEDAAAAAPPSAVSAGAAAEEALASPPPLLHHAAAALGLPMSLKADAGIANFYAAKKKVPMGGHVDDMERDNRYPVVSISLGCTGIFLVGGGSKDVAPTPIVVRSGDITILSGRARLAFHGVARVFEGTAPDDLFRRPEDALFSWYARNHRLNVNVRQVI